MLSRARLGARLAGTARSLFSTPAGRADVIHDYVEPVEFTNFDVCITDVTHLKLMTEIKDALAAPPYLSPAHPTAAAWPVHGMLYGRAHRRLANMVVTYRKKSIWVTFLVDTAAPLTYLAPAACEALGLRDVIPSEFGVNIHGYGLLVKPTPTDPRTCHFVGVNVLGADFLWEADADLISDRNTMSFSIHPKRALDKSPTEMR